MKVTILDENAIHDIGHAFGCYDYGQDVRPHPIPRCGETVTGKKKAKDNMKITIIAALMIFLAYFLILYGGVGFIQDKRFFPPRRRRIWPRSPTGKSVSPAHMRWAG